METLAYRCSSCSKYCLILYISITDCLSGKDFRTGCIQNLLGASLCYSLAHKVLCSSGKKNTHLSYRVFIKYCVFFSKILKYIPDSGLSRFFLCVHFMLGPLNGRQNTSATAELAELRKITTFSGKNTIFNEHPVLQHCKIGQVLLKNLHIKQKIKKGKK